MPHVSGTQRSVVNWAEDGVCPLHPYAGDQGDEQTNVSSKLNDSSLDVFGRSVILAFLSAANMIWR